MAALLLPVALTGSLLVGCSSDDDDPKGPDMTEISSLLLTQEDVPSAEVTDGGVLPSSLTCSGARASESSMVSFAQGRLGVRGFVADGTTVATAVYEIESDFQRDIVFAGGVVRSVPDCIANTKGRILSGDVVTTVRNTALTGLPDGAVGYAGALRSSDGAVQVEERAYALVGDRVVVVSARRDDDGPLGVDVPALLATALAKVAAAPAGEQQPA